MVKQHETHKKQTQQIALITVATALLIAFEVFFFMQLDMSGILGREFVVWTLGGLLAALGLAYGLLVTRIKSIKGMYAFCTMGLSAAGVAIAGYLLFFALMA